MLTTNSCRLEVYPGTVRGGAGPLGIEQELQSRMNEVACIMETVAKFLPQPDTFIWKRLALPEAQKEISEAIRRDSAGK